MIVPTFHALGQVLRQMFAVQLQQQQQHTHNQLHYLDLSPARTINQLLVCPCASNPVPPAVCVFLGFNQIPDQSTILWRTILLQARISLVHITLEPINASRTTSCLIEEVAEPDSQPEIKPVAEAQSAKVSKACVESILPGTVEKLETADQVQQVIARELSEWIHQALKL